MLTRFGWIATATLSLALLQTTEARERVDRPGGFIPPGGDRAECGGLNGGFTIGGTDPGVAGPFDVGQTEYNLSVGGFIPEAFEGEDLPVEERAAVFYPRPLACGPFPVVLIMHGSHGTCYSDNGGYSQNWPCPETTPLPLPSFRGYDYLAQRLASNGIVVVSISANGINAAGPSYNWNEARGELFQHHLDILHQLNTTNGPALGGLLKGRLNLQRVGTLGHSRGGEGAVRHAQINADQGSPYTLKAVFLLAPTQSNDQIVAGIPLAVLLPYCDGDQEVLPGTGYYDGARYAIPGDPAPKYSLEVMGANHNYFNTYWDDNFFGPGALDDAPDGIFDDNVCRFGTAQWPRLTSAQQQGSLIAMASAFFRVHLRGERNFERYLRGDAAPPASALTQRIFTGYHPPDNPGMRLDINRVENPGNDTLNTLGGAVIPSLTLDSSLCDPTQEGSAIGCLHDAPEGIFLGGRAPHWENSHHNAGQMRLAWGASRQPAVWENQIPKGFADLSRFSHIQMRSFVDFFDDRNAVGQPQDFSVELEDGAGLTARVPVSDHSAALFFPPSDPEATTFNDPVPHAVLNTLRVPLGAFGGLFKTDIRAVRLVFDRTFQGAINVADLMLADEADNLSPAVTCTVAQETLPPTGSLVDVGLNVAVDDPDDSGPGPIDIDVFSDQDDPLQPGDPDALLAGQTLQLRGERDPQVGGRVYLIVSRGADGEGAQGFGCCTVTVPQGDATTPDRAAAALQQCTSFAAAGADLLPPPDGYFRVGD
jgi:hypothetical protein